MKHEIKKGLLDATPDLQKSKARVKKAVLQPSKKPPLLPRFVLGCFILLAIALVSTEWRSNDYVQGFSEETLKMYGLMDDADHSEQYRQDLVLVKYGELKGVEISKQDVKNLIASYEAEFPTSFDKILKKNGITRTAYKKQFLALKAQVQIVRDALLPQYEKVYPQFRQEVHAQLLLFDAVEEVEAEDIQFAATVNIQAIVLYEGENARILALLDEKRFIEEQLIIMPIRDKHTLKIGDEVLLENSFLMSTQTGKTFKRFAVSQDVTVITTNKTTTIPAMQKKVNGFFEKITWHDISQTKEPDIQLKTINGYYSVWYGDDIVIGSGNKGFIISSEILQEWGKGLIQ